MYDVGETHAIMNVPVSIPRSQNYKKRRFLETQKHSFVKEGLLVEKNSQNEDGNKENKSQLVILFLPSDLLPGIPPVKSA